MEISASSKVCFEATNADKWISPRLLEFSEAIKEVVFAIWWPDILAE